MCIRSTLPTTLALWLTRGPISKSKSNWRINPFSASRAAGWYGRINGPFEATILASRPPRWLGRRERLCLGQTAIPESRFRHREIRPPRTCSSRGFVLSDMGLDRGAYRTHKGTRRDHHRVPCRLRWFSNHASPLRTIRGLEGVVVAFTATNSSARARKGAICARQRSVPCRHRHRPSSPT